MGDAATRLQLPALLVEITLVDASDHRHGGELRQGQSALRFRGRVLDARGRATPMALDGELDLADRGFGADRRRCRTVVSPPPVSSRARPGCGAPCTEPGTRPTGGRSTTSGPDRCTAAISRSMAASSRDASSCRSTRASARAAACAPTWTGADGRASRPTGSEAVARRSRPARRRPATTQGRASRCRSRAASTSVRPDAELRIDLSDPSGILITGHTPQNGIIVTIDDNSTNRQDVTSSLPLRRRLLPDRDRAATTCRLARSGSASDPRLGGR